MLLLKVGALPTSEMWDWRYHRRCQEMYWRLAIHGRFFFVSQSVLFFFITQFRQGRSEEGLMEWKLFAMALEWKESIIVVLVIVERYIGDSWSSSLLRNLFYFYLITQFRQGRSEEGLMKRKLFAKVLELKESIIIIIIVQRCIGDSWFKGNAASSSMPSISSSWNSTKRVPSRSYFIPPRKSVTMACAGVGADDSGCSTDCSAVPWVSVSCCRATTMGVFHSMAREVVENSFSMAWLFASDIVDDCSMAWLFVMDCLFVPCVFVGDCSSTTNGRSVSMARMPQLLHHRCALGICQLLLCHHHGGIPIHGAGGGWIFPFHGLIICIWHGRQLFHGLIVCRGLSFCAMCACWGLFCRFRGFRAFWLQLLHHDGGGVRGCRLLLFRFHDLCHVCLSGIVLPPWMAVPFLRGSHAFWLQLLHHRCTLGICQLLLCHHHGGILLLEGERVKEDIRQRLIVTKVQCNNHAY